MPARRRDGLQELQQAHNARLQAAQAAAAAPAEEETDGAAAAPEGSEARAASAADRLRETVELLAGCRAAEVASLEGLSGRRKLLMAWR